MFNRILKIFIRRKYSSSKDYETQLEYIDHYRALIKVYFATLEAVFIGYNNPEDPIPPDHFLSLDFVHLVDTLKIYQKEKIMLL